METVNFYLNEDIKIQYGVNKTELEIPRLKFGKAGVVINMIADIMSKSTAGALEIIGKTIALKTQEAKLYVKNSRLVEEFTKQLINTKNFTIIKRLLPMLSSGKIDEKVMEELQFSEACAILSYLLDQNFDSLKNLSASLEAISTSEKSENEK